MRFFFLFCIILLSAGCIIDNGDDLPEQEETPAPAEDGYYLGITPTPRTVPETDLAGAYEETGKICDVVEVWPSPSGIGSYSSLVGSRTITGIRVYGLKPIINMQFYTFEKIPGEGLKMIVDAPAGYEKNLSNPGFREAYMENAKNIAEEFHPEYLSLGNEVTAYYMTYPDDFDNFVSLYLKAYDEVKKVSPDTKVFVVFSQNQIEETDSWEIINKFGNQLDLLAFTTYPWKFYDNPEEIPEDYYTKLRTYSSKPIAFTEIGWPSAESANSSEKEQADYLKRFVELTDSMNIEFVNWLFLHEVEMSGTTLHVSDRATETIALKKSDGTEKEVYYVWTNMKKG